MPTLKRSVILLVALLAGAITALATGASANAAPSPYGNHPSCSASSTTVAAGGSITLTCVAFRPGGTASIELLGPPVSLGTATVGPDGGFTATVTIPSDTRPGNHPIKVSEPPVRGGPGGAKNANVRITVTAPGAGAAAAHTRLSAKHLHAKQAAASTPLAYKSAAFLGVGALGIILFVGGGVTLLLVRRRKYSA